MALPLSFDSDNHAYRFRFLVPTSQFLARHVLDTHGTIRSVSMVDNDVRGVGKRVYRNNDRICSRMCLYVAIPKR
nr:translocase of chloroplast 159, chloroplastic [Tanacetum cinerariifolium]